MTRFACVEAGGTTIKLCIAEDDITNIIERHVIPTTTPDETLPKISEWFRTREFDAIGVASFGPVGLSKGSDTYGYITTTPKPHWHMANILGALDEFDCPKGFDTDVNGAAVAHVDLPAPLGAVSSCVYVTIGTGIGAGVVVNGAPVHGMLHPEAGHMLVPRCPGDESFKGLCEYHGPCLEGLARGGAIADRAGVAMKDLVSLPDDHPVWDTAAFYISALCVNLAFTISPERIVLGGGIMQRKCLFPLIRKRFVESLAGYLDIEQFKSKEGIENFIIASPYGDNAGLVGAAELARLALSAAGKDRGI